MAERPDPGVAVAGMSVAPRAAEELHAGYMVSLIDPGFTPPRPDTVRAENHLVLHVDDITSPPGAVPAPDHIAQLMAFTRHWNEDGVLLIHCMAGVSRSAAAAFAVLCQRRPGRPAAIAEAMTRQPYITQPNRQIVALADRYLGAGGELEQALARWRPSALLSGPSRPYLYVPLTDIDAA